MKGKPVIHSKGEQKVRTILEERLQATPLQVFGPHLRISSIIEKEPSDHLPEDLFRYYTMAEIDFVIAERRPPCDPVLGIEFDEPQHETDPKKIRNDRLKNRLCQLAGLPLLRVRYPEIEPLFVRDSLLSCIVDIILRYKSKHEGKDYGVLEWGTTLNAKEYDDINRHELTEVWRLENQLARHYRIFRSVDTEQLLNARFAFDFQLGSSFSGFSETEDLYEGNLVLRRVISNRTPDQWPLVHRVWNAVTLVTRYQTTGNPCPDWSASFSDLKAMQNYIDWLKTDPLYHPQIPGLSWSYLAWDFLEALCLRQLWRDLESRDLVIGDHQK